jgi:tetratricopeptide (TPR) repeat protein
MRRIKLCGGLIILIIGFALHAESRLQEPKQAVANAVSREAPGRAGSQRELDAYRRLRFEVDPAVKRSLIQKFAADYPESQLLAFVYQEGAYLGRLAHNVDVMADFGAKSLEHWPDNYELRTELGSVFVQRGRVAEAESQAARALELVVVADKPASLTDPQWDAAKKMLLAGNHRTLGFVHLRRAQAEQDAAGRREEAGMAIRSFQRALEYHAIDDFSYYGLGFAHGILDDYTEAESNLARSVAIGGVVMASARILLEEIYRSRHNQSLNGLDLVIARAKAELGLTWSRGRNEPEF